MKKKKKSGNGNQNTNNFKTEDSKPDTNDEIVLKEEEES